MADFIKERLNHSLGACVRGARALSDARDKVPLGRGHDLPPSPTAMIHLCWSEPEASVLRKVMAGKLPCVMGATPAPQMLPECIGRTDSGRYDLGEGAWFWLFYALEGAEL